MGKDSGEIWELHDSVGKNGDGIRRLELSAEESIVGLVYEAVVLGELVV